MLTLQFSQGAGPGGTPRLLCVLDPPTKNQIIYSNKKAWENKIKPLSCLQCESSAGGHGSELWLSVWECRCPCVWGLHAGFRLESLFSWESYKFRNSSANLQRIEIIRLIYRNEGRACVWGRRLSSVGWRVSEGSICPSPLPELAMRELIFMGHRLLFPPEAEIQVNSRSIQEHSAPRWHNKLCSLPINILCLWWSNKGPVEVGSLLVILYLWIYPET